MAVMLDWIDRLMVQYPQLKYDDFKDIVDYAQKHGEEATLVKVTSMLNNQNISNVIQEKLRGTYPQLNAAQRNTLGANILSSVQQQFELIHSPRARPALDNNLRLEQANVNQEARALLRAKWTLPMDDSADPKARNVQVVNPNVTDKPFTPLFVDKMIQSEVQANAENVLRHTKKMTPARPAPKYKKDET